MGGDGEVRDDGERTHAVIRDGTMDQENYRDHGCEYAPSCLRCPFVVCQFELPPAERVGSYKHGQRLRAERVLALLTQGLEWREIAAQLGCSLRTVSRAARKGIH